MGGNIPGGNFLGENFPWENFPGGVWWVGILRVGIFSGWNFIDGLQGKHKSRQIERRFSDSESLGRVRILFKFRKLK